MLGVVIGLLVLGVLLLLLEIVFIPGTTIVGIGGVVILIIGIYLAYGISATVGHLSLAGSLVLVLLALGVMLKARTWERLALNDSITSKSPANVAEGTLNVGDTGITIGRLNPVGNANFGDRIVEVHSIGEFIEEDTPIEVVRISGNRVVVKRS